MALDYLVCLHLVDTSDPLAKQDEQQLGLPRESTTDMDGRRGWSELSNCITTWARPEVDLGMAILAATSVFPLQVQGSNPELKQRSLVTETDTISARPSGAGETAAAHALHNDSASSRPLPVTTARHGSPQFLSFTQTPVRDSNPYTFMCPLSCQAQGAQKRCRPLTDVDGPRTACQPSKRRRLLRQTFTSPLSAASSVPASYTVKRDPSAAVSTRHLRLSAIIQARRDADSAAFHPAAPISRQPPSQSEMYRRAAILNRYRLAMLPTLLRHNDSGTEHLDGGTTPSVTKPLGPSPPVLVDPRLPSSTKHGTVPLAENGSSRVHGVASKHTSTLCSGPGASPSGSDLVRPTASTNSRLPPRLLKSPLLRPACPKSAVPLEPLDDEGDCAFPTSAHESRYEDSDDPDDVYADFAAIFGGSGLTDNETDLEGDSEGYEDVMDELDGIPWGMR